MPERIELYQHPSPLFLEAFDDIIIELTKEGAAGSAQVLGFCGSDPGVGTTTVVINLAISLAMAQWKTLLIDGDMRKQSAHKHLSSGNQFGLSDYLQGQADINATVCATNHSSLHFLPCGSPIAHPLRLMGSRYFSQLLKKLTPHYNFILIDAPSIAAAHDIAAIARVSDKVFAVAEPNRTNKNNLANLRNVLNADEHKIGGVIVNKVDDKDYRRYRANYDYFEKEQYLTRKNKQKLEKQAIRKNRAAYMRANRAQTSVPEDINEDVL